MFAMSSIAATLIAFLMAMNLDGTPIMTSSTPATCNTSNLFASMRDSTSILSNEAQLISYETATIFGISDAGPCFQNSTIADIQRSLDTISPSNVTAVKIETSIALAKLSKIIDTVVQNRGLSDDTNEELRALENGTTHALGDLILCENMTQPEVTIGLICQNLALHDFLLTERKFLSTMNGIKNLYDTMKAIFNQPN